MAESKYGKYLVRKPIYETAPPKEIELKGRQIPTMTYMSNDLVPGCNMYLEFGWIWEIPTPNPHIFEHSHVHDEIVLHIGGDPNNPEDLGADMTFTVDGDHMKFDTSYGVFIPKGVPHGPLIWHNFRKPHIEMAIMLGAGTLKEGWGFDVAELNKRREERQKM